jgi:hypothetical protein
MQCPQCDNIVTIKTSVGSHKCLRCLFEWWGTTPRRPEKSGVTDEDLTKWLELKNKMKPELHSDVPKGATIEIDPDTGKAVPRDNY